MCLFVKTPGKNTLLIAVSEFTGVLDERVPYFDRLYLTLPMGDTLSLPDISGILMLLSLCWIEAIPSCLPSKRQKAIR